MSDSRHSNTQPPTGVAGRLACCSGNDTPTLTEVRHSRMSSRPQSRILRGLTIGLTLLHLALIPASRYLHIGCDHAHSSCCGSSCQHAHPLRARYRNRQQYRGSRSPDQPLRPSHDPDSCPVCQILFCPSIPVSGPPDLWACVPVRSLDALREDAPLVRARFRRPVRGPPVVLCDIA